MATVIIAFIFTRVLSDPNYDIFYASGLWPKPVIAPLMICPVEGFPDAFSFSLPTCTPAAVYIPRALGTYHIGPYLPTLLKGLTVASIQFHAIVLALFASIVGPFGGVFASGLKRAIKVKDFNNVIPGHGGFVDRMDCQLIMGLFAYVYFTSAVATVNASTTAAQALLILSRILPPEKLEVVRKIITEALATKGS